jgi:hypothetical protein
MPNSDIHVGWVNSESSGCANGCIFDYKSFAYQLPALDSSQDVTLVRGWEEGPYTAIEFVRPLIGLPEGDLTIDPEEPIAVIWALNNEFDPDESGNSFSKHNKRQQPSQKINVTFAAHSSCGDIPTSPPFSSTDFSTGTTGGVINNPCNDVDCEEIIIRFNNYTIPNATTTYVCLYYSFPDEFQDIVRFEPIVDNFMVHHMLIYELVAAESHTGPYSCPMLSGNHVWGYAPGGVPVVLPSNVGYRIGIGMTQFVTLQMHYDNPQRLNGQKDSSGVRLWVTSNLRTYRSGVISHVPDPSSIRIPPRTPSFQVTGYMDPGYWSVGCIPENQPIKVFAGSFHFLS